MKIETPHEFQLWLDEYKHSANYFMIGAQTKDQLHALFITLRDAFIAGSKPVGDK